MAHACEARPHELPGRGVNAGGPTAPPGTLDQVADGVGSDRAALQKALPRRHDPPFLRGLRKACEHLLPCHLAPSKALSTRVRDLMPVHAVLPEGFEFRSLSRGMTLIMSISDTLHRLNLAAISASIGVCVKVVKLPHHYVEYRPHRDPGA
jgi:hypothetical protein